jgi:hypothetical protein
MAGTTHASPEFALYLLDAADIAE